MGCQMTPQEHGLMHEREVLTIVFALFIFEWVGLTAAASVALRNT